jgi:hypothetical protein
MLCQEYSTTQNSPVENLVNVPKRKLQLASFIVKAAKKPSEVYVILTSCLWKTRFEKKSKALYFKARANKSCYFFI